MDTGNGTMTQVDSDQNVRAIRQFRDSLLTTMGPKGSLKMMVTGGGYLQLTCLSTTLMKHMDLGNPICRYIGQVSSGLQQHGLYFSVLVSHLVEQQWSQDRVLSKFKLSQTVCFLIQTFQNILTSQVVCRKADFSTINSLLPLVKSVIHSKCFNLWPGFDVNKFCIEIIKVFINCIDGLSNSVGRVYVKVKRGVNHFSAHSGLMYEIFEKHDVHNIKQIKGKLSILVFTIRLEEHNEDSVTTSKLISVIEQAITLKLKLVACQKTVSPEIKLYLMRKNIVLLDRMGTDFTRMLLHLSNAVPISEICSNIPNVNKMMGNLSSIQHVYFNDSDYILLKSDDVSLGTLLIQHSGLAGIDHIKSLVEQAISSLRSLAKHPVLISSGGCLEVWLIAQLNLLKASRIDKEFCTILHWIERAFLSTCGLFPPIMMDSVYHHGWDEEHFRCRCGFVTKPLIEQNEGSFMLLCDVMNSKAELNSNASKQLSTTIHPDLLVDSYEQKINVIFSAMETFASLSEISFIVYKH